MSSIESRKRDHLQLAASADVEHRVAAGWDDVRLLHEAVPDLDLEAVDTSVDFLGRRLAAPLVIAGMTGGFAGAVPVNECLAAAAERHDIAVGVGSQRAALQNPDLWASYRIVRQAAPQAFVIANVGAPQLIAQAGHPALSPAQVQSAVDEIRADALAIHFNYLQETVQVGGDRRAAGVLAAVAGLVRQVSVPVIAKETGAGLAPDTAARLASTGVAALDVGGVGGTSFAAVEGERAARAGRKTERRLGEVFREWGIPTAVSTVAAAGTGLPVIATGGIRTGLDAAKALALGATAVGVARPLLQAALGGGAAAVDRWIEQFLAELRAALFLTGSPTPADLRRRPRAIVGETRTWLEQSALLDSALRHD